MYLRSILLIMVALSPPAFAQQAKSLEQSAARAQQQSNDEMLMNDDRDLSDLELQALLAGMLKDGSLPRPNANTICVVFLAPELHSTLGTMIAGKHYIAYHSFFNSMGTRLHYAVVPFEADPKSAYQIALRVFASAALNPNGTASK